MTANSKIEWTDHTFNPWLGCTRISPGCDSCYAAVSTPARAMHVTWGPNEPRRRTSPSTWAQPVAWNRRHQAFFAQHGRRQRVFCASLADVFDNAVDPQWREDLFALINATPNLDWLLLTKRIGNVPLMVSLIPGWMPANVWLGITVVNQAEADRDIPKLLAVPAAKRFLSMEPLLGPVSFEGLFANTRDMRDGTNALEWIDWVIVGGESGPDARPMSIQWARELRSQCAAVRVPFLFKQWGEWAPSKVYRSEEPGRFAFGDYEHDRSQFVRTDRYPRAFTKFGARCIVERVGKKAAGRLLDGRTYDEVPS